MKSIALFNNKGGVGKTSLVYHLTWMFQVLGCKAIAVDLDPQANLSSFFLDYEAMEDVWGSSRVSTVWNAIAPLKKGLGDIAALEATWIDDGIALIPGDLNLSSYEDELADSWTKALDGDERGFRVLTAFSRVIEQVGAEMSADVALIDMGPNLGSINRATLISSDFVILPLGPDLFSLQGLRNVGPALQAWRRGWRRRKDEAPQGIFLPEGGMQPAGYIMMRHSVRLDRAVKAYDRWMGKVPAVYRQEVLREPLPENLTIASDPHCLSQLKDYRSLMPMAQESRKPMFFLKPGDGAIGGHQAAVQACYRDFRALTLEVAKRCGVALPSG